MKQGNGPKMDRKMNLKWIAIWNLKTDQKWTKNGTKMNQKWTANKPKMDRKMDLKWIAIWI